MKAIDLFFMSLAAMALVACGSHNGHDHDTEGHDHEKEQTGHFHHEEEIIFSKRQCQEAGIELETIKPGTFRAVMNVSGQIVSGQNDEQIIVAPAGGIVTFADASITEGTAIGVGQTIALVSARKMQDGDPADKARAAYEAAKGEYDRAKGLVDDRIMSQREFSQIRMQYETARLAYEALAGRSTSGGVAVAAAKAGYIKNRLVAQGEYVVAGQAIATVTQCRRLQLRADVQSCDMAILADVAGANFRMAGSQKVYRLDSMRGKLLAYGRTVSDGSPYVAVSFEFDNVGDIVPGAFTDVWLLMKERKNAITVPLTALTEEQGTKFVYVQVEPEAYVRREVKTGQSDGCRVEITDGLKAGEKVVAKGAYMVKLASASNAIPGHTHNH